MENPDDIDETPAEEDGIIITHATNDDESPDFQWW